MDSNTRKAIEENARILRESGTAEQFAKRARMFQDSGLAEQIQRAQDLRNRVHELHQLTDQAQLTAEARRLSDSFAESVRLASEAARVARSLPDLEQLRVEYLG